jgi:hypothetical protein
MTIPTYLTFLIPSPHTSKKDTKNKKKKKRIKLQTKWRTYTLNLKSSFPHCLLNDFLKYLTPASKLPEHICGLKLKATTVKIKMQIENFDPTSVTKIKMKSNKK